MITHEEAKNQCTLYAVVVPDPVFTFFAYKDGAAQECTTQDEARKISTNYERVETAASKEARGKAKNHNLAVSTEIFNIWYNALKEDYPITEKQFDVLYAQAYDQSHSYGYDEVASTLDTLYGLCVAFRGAAE